MRIVVRGTNWIGDAVMTVPALRELRRIFPDSRIAYHTRSWAEGLFRDCDFIDEIVAYEKSASSIKDVYRQSARLRKGAFDFGVLLPNSFESALTMQLAGVTRRFGYGSERRGILLTDAVAVPDWKGSRHEVYYYANLVAEIEKKVLGKDTVDITRLDGSIDMSQARRSEARAMLAAAGVDFTKPTVALGVGSANSRAKRWPAERYAQLADKLVDEIGVGVILVGSKDDLDISNEVSAKCTVKPISLSGKTDIASAAAILGEIGLLISNDMGLAHIAPAVGTETIVIFGPTNPETTRPFPDSAAVIREQVECSPCMLRDCPIDHRCMTRVSVEEVFEAARLKLEKGRNK